MDRFIHSRLQLKKLLKIACGDLDPDFIIQNIQILDL
jgi:hypothetical protein